VSSGEEPFLVATGFFLAAGLDALDEDWVDIVATNFGCASMDDDYFGFSNFNGTPERQVAKAPHSTPLLPPKQQVSSFVSQIPFATYLSRERRDEVEVLD
jgi:hypothetical protein